MIYKAGLLSNIHAAGRCIMLHGCARVTCEQRPTLAQGGFHKGGSWRNTALFCLINNVLGSCPWAAGPFILSSSFSGLSVPICILIQQSRTCAVSFTDNCTRDKWWSLKLLCPSSRFVFEKIISLDLVNKFPVFYRKVQQPFSSVLPHNLIGAYSEPYSVGMTPSKWYPFGFLTTTV